MIFCLFWINVKLQFCYYWISPLLLILYRTSYWSELWNNLVYEEMCWTGFRLTCAIVTNVLRSTTVALVFALCSVVSHRVLPWAQFCLLYIQFLFLSISTAWTFLIIFTPTTPNFNLVLTLMTMNPNLVILTCSFKTSKLLSNVSILIWMLMKLKFLS